MVVKEVRTTSGLFQEVRELENGELVRYKERYGDPNTTNYREQSTVANVVIKRVHCMFFIHTVLQKPCDCLHDNLPEITISPLLITIKVSFSRDNSTTCWKFPKLSPPSLTFPFCPRARPAPPMNKSSLTGRNERQSGGGGVGGGVLLRSHSCRPTTASPTPVLGDEFPILKLKRRWGGGGGSVN